MPPMVPAVVWTWWISIPLVAGGVLAIVGTILGYLKKVESLKYPKQR